MSISVNRYAGSVTAKGNQKPDIVVVKGQLPSQVNDAQRALRQFGEIYQRKDALVRVLSLPPGMRQEEVLRQPGTMMIADITAHWLVPRLASAAQWVKVDRRSGLRVPCDPTLELARFIIDNSGAWPFPSLSGISQSPLLRPDGTILGKAGYDVSTGLLALFDTDDFPPVPQQPTREDALAAVQLLRDLLVEFPFEDGPEGTHSSVALAAILTSAARFLFPTRPLFAFTAGKAGSGKTELAQVAPRIVSGREAAVASYTDDEPALQNLIFSVLMAGDANLVLDNVEGLVESPILCATSTSPEFQHRLFHKQIMRAVPTNTVVSLTGNNLQIIGDLVSRVLLCRLQSAGEHPGERKFKFCLRDRIAEQRGIYLTAALTILRAYIVAGKPAMDITPCRFREWSLIRHALVWCGCKDPLNTQRELEELDPERIALVALKQTLSKKFGDAPTTVREMIRAIDPESGMVSPGLEEALLEIAGDGKGKVSSRKLSAYLARNARRVDEGLVILEGPKDPATQRKTYSVSSDPSGSSVYSLKKQQKGLLNVVKETDAENAVNAVPATNPSPNAARRARMLAVQGGVES